MTVNRSKAIKGLRQKGFHKGSSTHHLYFHHKFKGKETGPYAYVSHSKQKKDISGNLLLSMRKTLRLDSISQVVALLECPMDGDTYNSIIREKGVF
ncbi:MAG: hypothetical protein ACYS1A_03360 [Planctomycetota bacterium]|jgi:hypothetical protein